MQKCLSAIRKPTRIYRILKNNEELLREQVERQPVKVAIDGFILPSYKGGIISSFCGKALDTSALIVGFGIDKNGVGYWLLKSSLGPNWGEQGHLGLSWERTSAESPRTPSYQH